MATADSEFSNHVAEVINLQDVLTTRVFVSFGITMVERCATVIYDKCRPVCCSVTEGQKATSQCLGE